MQSNDDNHQRSLDLHLAKCADEQAADFWDAIIQPIEKKKVKTNLTKKEVQSMGRGTQTHSRIRMFHPEAFDANTAKFIGEGACAEVYRVQSKSLGREVVLKKFFDYVPPIPIIRECQILRKLQHPRITTVYGWFFERGPFIVMEPCIGSLFYYVSSMTPREKLRAYIQMMQGVGFIHSKNIIHCDLKLENVLVTKDLNFKLGDFGEAVELSGCSYVTRTRKAGTNIYQSLDILNDKKYSKRSDLWAMGCTIFCSEMNGDPLVRCLDQNEETTEIIKNLIANGIPSEDEIEPVPLRERISKCRYSDVINELMFDENMTADRFELNEFVKTQMRDLYVNPGNINTCLTSFGNRSKKPKEKLTKNLFSNFQLIETDVIFSRFYFEAEFPESESAQNKENGSTEEAQGPVEIVNLD